MMRFLLALMLAMLGVSASAAPPSASEHITYTVKSGDTLIGLAERGFRRQGDYLVAQRLNRVRNPRVLRIGSTLRLPRRILRIEPIGARVIAFRGAAQVNGAAAQVDMPIAEGAVLTTGANAFLAMELADGSVLTLPSRSRMNVAGLHRIVLTGDEVKRFVLLNGRTETEVAPLKRGSSFEIATPISVAAVRGTRFRVSLGEADDSSGTGVLEGNVAVATQESAVEVPAGQGVTATEEGVGEPVPLLPKPTLLDPDRLQDEDLVTFAVEPVPGAALYRAQLATDAGFIDVFAEIESPTPQLSVADVPNGSFFVRLTAISPAGLEGLPAAYTFERRLNTITAEVGEADDCPAGRCLRFRWRAGGEGERRFRFQIARSPDGVPIVDRMEMTGSEIVITDLPGDTYYWRVESALIDGEERQSKWMDWQELRVAPASE
jgi:hypothetical protein